MCKLTEEFDSRQEWEKILTEAKHSGVTKAKVRALAIAAIEFLDNNVGLDKTFDTAFSREVLKAARADAVKMGATKDQLASFDAAIKVQNDLLDAYKKKEGKHVES